MATPLTNAPSKMTRDAEVLLGTIAAPSGPGQAVAAGTTYSFTPKKGTRALLVYGQGAGAGTVTLVAGVYPPALEAGQGNYVSASIAAAALAVIQFDNSRHMQADGSFQFTPSAAGTAWVVETAA